MCTDKGVDIEVFGEVVDDIIVGDCPESPESLISCIEIVSEMEGEPRTFQPLDLETRKAMCQEHQLQLKNNAELPFHNIGLPLKNKPVCKKIEGDGNCYFRYKNAMRYPSEVNYMNKWNRFTVRWEVNECAYITGPLLT